MDFEKNKTFLSFLRRRNNLIRKSDVNFYMAAPPAPMRRLPGRGGDAALFPVRKCLKRGTVCLYKV